MKLEGKNKLLEGENEQLKVLNEKLVSRLERMETELDIQGGSNPYEENAERLLFVKSDDNM